MMQQMAISFYRSTCPQFHLEFESGHFNSRLALRRLMEELNALELCSDARMNVELLLAEVFNNIVRHAYCEAEAGPIEVSAYQLEGEILIRVFDFGKELPPTSREYISEPHLPKMEPELPEGGFGWFLISQLSRRYRYWREDDKNCLEVSMDLDLGSVN